MTIIAEISNNEAGNSVRFKLNQVISAINAGNLTNTILSGQGVPNNALGKNGDFYLDTLTFLIYGPKQNNVWPTPGVSLVGAQGERGAQILSGTDVIPDISLGINGDYYLCKIDPYFLYGPKDEATTGWGTPIRLKANNLLPPQTKTFVAGTYTLTLNDLEQGLVFNSPDPGTVIIPTDAVVAFPVGTQIMIGKRGSGPLTIQGDTGVLLNGVSGDSKAIVDTWSVASLWKQAPDDWWIFGGLL